MSICISVKLIEWAFAQKDYEVMKKNKSTAKTPLVDSSLTTQESESSFEQTQADLKVSDPTIEQAKAMLIANELRKQKTDDSENK